MGEATIFDVARVAGVSKSTVSRVINGSSAVTDETREKIEKAMEELRYTPSAAARTLSSRQSNVIGVIFPDSSEYFFGQLLKGIIREADKHSMVVMQCNSYHDPEKESRALKMIAQQRVRGLIITPVRERYDDSGLQQEIVNALQSFHGPVVFVDRSIKEIEKDSVLFDNYKGGLLAAEKLAEDGVEKIGAIVVDTDLKLGSDRLHGFIDGLAKHGLNVEPDCVFTACEQMDEEEVARKSGELLDKLVPGGAVFLSNGFLSKIFLREVFARNLTLGQDIHCVAFDRIELLETLTNIPFSYIDRSEADMGKFAAQMLMERIDEMDCPDRRYLIPAKLYEN